jgi:glycosyltransferase involved in cell wall biosynthesis
MTSPATCYRCLLLFFLPFLIVFSVIYLTTTPSTTTTIETTTSSSSSLQSTTSRPKCKPYNVTDTRPFFDRELPQSNLPRRISKLTRNSLLRRLRSLRLALVACAYNVEKDVDKFREHVEPIVDLFHPTSRIIILESDSTDNTLAKLRQWSRAEVHTYGNLSETIPHRTERIAYCRNKLLEKVQQLQPDYMLILDVDIFAANVSSFLTNFEYDTNDWSVMTANLIEDYYDIWALRTLSDLVLNYDVWHRVWAMQIYNKYCSDSLIKYVVKIHQKPFTPDRSLLEVRSAFGGAGLYKMEAVEGCYYSGESVTCEHVPFHVCMREKNGARIFINPKFTNE